jgi:hypothetical protein
MVTVFPLGTELAGTAAGALSIWLRGTIVGVIEGTLATAGSTAPAACVGGGWGVTLASVGTGAGAGVTFDIYNIPQLEYLLLGLIIQSQAKVFFQVSI